MEMRKRQLIFIIGYALFVVTATQAFVPYGYQTLQTESLTFKLIMNVSFSIGYFCVAALCIIGGVRRIPLWAAIAAAAINIISQGIFFLVNYTQFIVCETLIGLLQVLVGFAYAILFSFWAGCSCILSSRDYRFCILAGSLLSSFAVIFLNAGQLPVLSLVCIGVFLVGSVCIAGFLLSGSEQDLSGSAIQTDRRKAWRGLSESLKSLIIPIICIGVLGFTYQCAFVIVGADSASGMFFAIGEAFAVSVIFLLLVLPNAQAFNLLAVFRILWPVAFASVGLLMFANGLLGLILMGVSSATFNLGLILLMPLCVSLGRKRGVSVSALYGISAGIANMFPALGYVVGGIPFDEATVSVYFAIAVLFIFLLCAAFLFDKNKGRFDVATESGFEIRQSDGSAIGSMVMGRNVVAAYLADEYGLTQREKEVLEALLLGRDAPGIADDFCISVNTVKTHIKRIYTKIDVHSRQELVSLVQDIEGSMKAYLLKAD